MNKFERLVSQKIYYNEKMGEVLNGTLHLKKEKEEVVYPISDNQNKKNLFLFKYYEYHYNRVDKLINESIINS